MAKSRPFDLLTFYVFLRLIGSITLVCGLSAITHVMCWSQPDESYGESGAYGYRRFSQRDQFPAEYAPVQYYNLFPRGREWTSGVEKYGHRHHYGEDTIIFYEDRYFQGISEPCSIDTPELKLRGRIQSFIVGGGPGSRWTVYNGLNYTGNAVCVLPPQVQPFKPALITDISEMELANVDIASVRKGCIPTIVPIDNPNYRLQRFS